MKKSNVPTNVRIVPDEFRVQPSTLKELCGMYRVSERSMRAWLAPIKPEIGLRNGRLYTVKQVKLSSPYRLAVQYT